MIFAPDDPGPVRPAAPPRAAALRITTPPWAMPARATCKRHQVFTDGCEACDHAIGARTVIRTRQHHRMVEREIMGAPMK